MTITPKRLCLICFQSPHAMGGIETVVRQLVALYSGQGHEVHICSAAPHRPTSDIPNSHSYYPLGTIFSQFLWPVQILFVLSLAVYLALLHARYRFDVFVPQDNYLHGMAAILAGKLTGVRVVVMDHGVVTNIADERWQHAWKRRHSTWWERLLWPFFDLGVRLQPAAFRFVTAGADRLFFTGYELDEFYRTYQAEGSKVRKYDHVIDIEVFSPARSPDERQELRGRLGVGPNEFVINTTSRLNFEKGYREILPAVATLIRITEEKVVLLIGGDDRNIDQNTTADGEKPIILSLIESLGLSHNVRLLGVLSPVQVRDLHRASDLHVYAGTMGCSFALCVLEAMACGLPSVVTSIPRKLADVITLDLGWVVPPGDERALTDALVAAYRSRHELRHKGARARNYAESHNSYVANAKFYQNVMFD